MRKSDEEIAHLREENIKLESAAKVENKNRLICVIVLDRILSFTELSRKGGLFPEAARVCRVTIQRSSLSTAAVKM